MFGVKMCVHQDQPQLYNLLCFIQQSLRVLQKEGQGCLGSRSISADSFGVCKVKLSPVVLLSPQLPPS